MVCIQIKSFQHFKTQAQGKKHPTGARNSESHSRNQNPEETKTSCPHVESPHIKFLFTAHYILFQTACVGPLPQPLGNVNNHIFHSHFIQDM